MATMTEREEFQRKLDWNAEYLDSVVSGEFDDATDAEEYEDCFDSYERLARYFEDVYDVEYSIGGDGSLRGVRVMIACGGPNIWVDTNNGCVSGAWGFSLKAESYLDRRTLAAMMNILSKLGNAFAVKGRRLGCRCP